jgi:toxin FitB
LRLWLEHELPAWFEGRVLAVDLPVADRWSRLLAEVGRPVPTIDSLLAATALHHELRLVTRNSVDFTYPGLEVINPFR